MATLGKFPDGKGPFVLYSIGGEVHALDLGSEGSGSVSLGIASDTYFYGKYYGNMDLAVVPSGDGSIALVSRSEIRKGNFLHKDRLRAIAVSPDGRWVVTATYIDHYMIDVWLHSVDGSVPTRRLESSQTSSDDSGGAFQMFWRDNKNVVILDACHCDGGQPSSTTYNLSIEDGERRELNFLESRDPYEYGPQLGSSVVAFDDVPSVDCFQEPDPCGDLVHSLMVADLAQGSLRRLARNRKTGFVAPQISLDGRVVASSLWDSGELIFRDAATGATIARVTQPGRVIPEAWVGNNILVVSAHPTEEEHVLLAVTLDRSGSTSVRELTRDREAAYVGWIR